MRSDLHEYRSMQIRGGDGKYFEHDGPLKFAFRRVISRKNGSASVWGIPGLQEKHHWNGYTEDRIRAQFVIRQSIKNKPWICVWESLVWA